jgi:hypothetical protein
LNVMFDAVPEAVPVKLERLSSAGATGSECQCDTVSKRGGPKCDCSASGSECAITCDG